MFVSGVASGLKRRIRSFRSLIKDESASATVEFVVALPFLLGIMAFSGELGSALKIKSAMDSAVRDATRIISLTPMTTPGTVSANGVDVALNVVRDRLTENGLEVKFKAISGQATCMQNGLSPCVRVSPITVTQNGQKFVKYSVTVLAEVEVESPLLALVNLREGGGPTKLGLISEDSQLHFSLTPDPTTGSEGDPTAGTGGG